MAETAVLLTRSSGAAQKRCKQGSEQVLLGKARFLLHHGERRPGGHTLELLRCQLVFEMEKLKNLDDVKHNKQKTFIPSFWFAFSAKNGTMQVLSK